MGAPITGEDLKFSSLKFGKIPVIVVLTNEERKREEMAQELRSKNIVVTAERIEDGLRRTIIEKRKQIHGLPDWKYVPTDSSKPLPILLIYIHTWIA